MNSAWSEAPRPAVLFLDRDGTVIVDRHYPKDPAKVALETGAAAGLRRFAAAGIKLVVVTNQSGIGRGLLTEADYARVSGRMVELLAAEGVTLDGIYHCPHAPEAHCRCRKPMPGLVERAVAELGLDPARSVVVGDKASDLGLAAAVGARAVLVTTGYGARTAVEAADRADAVVSDLAAAANLFGLP
ncbi:MAG: D-glycero-alpha-D-manno-heptose-1,7-bisphosphate 7-phosphatase [Pseudomonadota bacterium]